MFYHDIGVHDTCIVFRYLTKLQILYFIHTHLSQVASNKYITLFGTEVSINHMDVGVFLHCNLTICM